MARRRVIVELDLDMLFVTGRGHGGPALVANTWLEGTYSELFPEVSLDEPGMRRPFKQFSFWRYRAIAPRDPGLDPRGWRARLCTRARIRRGIRFHLVGDVIDRVPKLGPMAAYAKQLIRDKLIEHKQ